MTRAKFKCSNKTTTEGGYEKTYSVVLYPVTTGSEENKSFYASTPSGKIELTLTSENTFNLFKPGKEYYVDFTPAG